MLLSIRCTRTLLETGQEGGNSQRFSKTPNVVAGKTDATARTDECLLRRGEIRSSAGNGRLSWKGNCARGNITTTPGDFETEAIADLVLPGLMYFDQYVLVALICDRPAWLDAGPIEHSKLM